MPSIRANILNFFLRHTIKPVIRYSVKKLSPIPNIQVIKRLRKIVNYFPMHIPRKAKIKQLMINDIPVTEVQADEKTSVTLVYLHGGGYVVGSPKVYVDLAYRLAIACSAKVLLINYSLSPEKKFPTALNEVLRVFDVLSQNPSPLFLAGDSSGGGLVLSVLIALRDNKKKLPLAAVCLSPWTDLALTGKSLQTNNKKDPILSMPLCQLYAKQEDIYNPLASPLYADLKGLPPLLIQVSNIEVLLDDARRIEQKASNEGVCVDLEIWENLPHIWHLFSFILPEGKKAIKRIGNFIQSHAAKLNKG